VAIDGSKFKAVNNPDKNFTDRKLKAGCAACRAWPFARAGRRLTRGFMLDNCGMTVAEVTE
jgi:hypothetical protein